MDETNKEVPGSVETEEREKSDAEQVGLSTELEKLRRELEAKELEAKQHYERFLRQAAELDNFKKRAAKEREESLRYGNESLIRDLLPILDNLERALAYAKGGGNGRPVLEGVEMTLRSFLDVLGKHGVRQITAKGELFDPQKHEAIAQVETEEVSPNRVVEEHHKGYFLLDRLLRPALVSTAKPPKESGDNEGEGEG
jgi:molecular chaperone GrpE